MIVANFWTGHNPTFLVTYPNHQTVAMKNSGKLSFCDVSSWIHTESEYCCLRENVLPRTVIMYREIFLSVSKAKQSSFLWTSEVNGTSSLLCCVVSCPTLCNPMDYSQPGSSVPWGFSRQKILEWVAMPSSRDLPNPGIEPRSPTLQEDSLPSEPPGKPKNTGGGSKSLLQGIFLTRDLNRAPALQVDSLPAELPGKPPCSLQCVV